MTMLHHDRRPERPQTAGQDRDATRDSKRDSRVEDAKNQTGKKER